MTRLLILPAIFVASTLFLWLMISKAPGWNEDEVEKNDSIYTNSLSINNNINSSMF